MPGSMAVTWEQRQYRVRTKLPWYVFSDLRPQRLDARYLAAVGVALDVGIMSVSGDHMWAPT